MSRPSTLLEASCCSDFKAVVNFLKNVESTEYKEDLLIEVDTQGYTAASWACCHDNLNILCLLLKALPAYITMFSQNGASLLHLASQHKSLRCLDHVLEVAPQLLNVTNSFKETPLHLAAGIGDIKTVERLLQHGPACMLRDQYGRSPNTVRCLKCFLCEL